MRRGGQDTTISCYFVSSWLNTPLVHSDMSMGAIVYIVVLITVSSVWAPGIAAANSDLKPYLPAELLILQRFEEGRPAILCLDKPNPGARRKGIKPCSELPEEQRTIRGPFLKALVMNQLPNKINLPASVKTAKNNTITVTIPPRGIGIANCIVTGPVRLSHAKIPHGVALKGCHFEQRVDFSKSYIGGDLILAESLFEGQARFNQIHVSGVASLEDVTLDRGVSLAGANFESDVRADGIHFTSASHHAVFRRMRVGGVFTMQNAVAAGEVHAVGLNIGSSLDFHNTAFQKLVTFKETRVANRVLGTEAYFGHMANFEEMKAHRIVLDKTTFTDFVSFRHLHTEFDFWVRDARFLNRTNSVGFSFMEVGGSAIFHDSVFLGPVDLVGMTIRQSLHLVGAKFLNTDQPVELRSSRIGQSLMIQRAIFNSSVDMIDLTYRHLGTKSWEEGIAELHRIPYLPSLYQQFEEFWRESGDPHSADNVHIAERRREREETSSWVTWGKNAVLDLLVAYGLKPERAFLWSLGFILIGSIVFRRRGMQLQQPHDGHQFYSALWYSVDLFLPFVQLQLAEKWTPINTRRWALHYARVHTILGWIMIPIGLAAVTGIIK